MGFGIKENFDSEWVLTNKVGGYALGFGNFLNKRKYNGLLISSSPSNERVHILGAIEEKVEGNNTYFYLDSNHYVGSIYPKGHTHIVGSWLRPYPCVLFSTNPFSEDNLIFKEIFMLQKKNAVAIKYTNIGLSGVELVLRPKFTLRGHHEVNSSGTWDRTVLHKEKKENGVYIKRHGTEYGAYTYIEKGEIIDTDIIFKSVYYPMEAARGYDSIEDLISPHRIQFSLGPKESCLIVVASEELTDPMGDSRKAESYYKSFPLPKTHPANKKPREIFENDEVVGEFDKNGYLKILEMAANDFVVHDDDIIAGYPWFGAWGRDTLISMEAFHCLKNGNELAKAILKKYSKHIKNGVLPNTFGEGGEGLNYSTVDAPLWFVLRAYQYAKDDKDIAKGVVDIVLNYLNYKEHPFFVGDDGLIEIKKTDHAMTWMDAIVYGIPVTPRCGKPIEINGLWYNSLCILKEISKTQGSKVLVSGDYSISTDQLDLLINKVKESMQKFVLKDYLADRIEDNRPIDEVRPNVVTALSLPFDFVSKDIIKKCWLMAKEDLLTKRGLRSLSPKCPAFKEKYIGGQRQRDYAYHQGTVWAFLLMPFIKVAMKANEEKSKKELASEVRGYISEIRNDFISDKISSVAEVWDGIDFYFPKGCPAQAWSVFAILEAECLLNEWGYF
ncbi:amylo-alpha-1,6-glucosidase [bacterium]|nr:amylo-alpha-1,6-glucosidase [bacterium]